MADIENENTSEETKKRILEKTKVLVDEFGKTYELVPLGEITFPAAALRLPGRRIPRDTRKFKFADDDTLIVTFPKTGAMCSCELFCVVVGVVDVDVVDIGVVFMLVLGNIVPIGRKKWKYMYLSLRQGRSCFRLCHPFHRN